MSEPLPGGWAEATLEDVALWSSGGTPSRANAAFYSGTIPWLKTGELGPRSIFRSEECISPEALASSSAKVFPKGSVAVAMYGATIGKASILGVDAATNQACAVGVPDAVGSEFLYYYLLSQTQGFIDAGKGGAQPNISQGIVKSWSLLVPPKVEQTRIVAKLEELLSDLDAGVAELKAAQKKLARHRQSLLKSAVDGTLTAAWRAQQKSVRAELVEAPGATGPSTSSGRTGSTESGTQLLTRILTERRARWEAKQLAKFKEQGKTPLKDWQSKYPEPAFLDASALPLLPDAWTWATIDQLSPDDLANGRSVPSADDGAKVLRLTALKNGQVDLSEYKCGAWTESEAQPFAITEGDLLIARGNGSLKLVGRAGLVSRVTGLVAYPDTMIRLRLVESIVRPAWIGFLWDSALVRTHMERRARTSAGIYKISQPDIVSVVVPVPPLAEQDQILEESAREVEQLLRAAHAVDVAMKQSTAQRKNILQAAFSGQLVPQDPNDEPASVLLDRIRAERLDANMKKPRQKAKARA